MALLPIESGGGIPDAPSDAICTVMDATGCRVYMPGDDVGVVE